MPNCCIIRSHSENKVAAVFIFENCNFCKIDKMRINIYVEDTKTKEKNLTLISAEASSMLSRRSSTSALQFINARSFFIDLLETLTNVGCKELVAISQSTVVSLIDETSSSTEPNELSLASSALSSSISWLAGLIGISPFPFMFSFKLEASASFSGLFKNPRIMLAVADSSSFLCLRLPSARVVNFFVHGFVIVECFFDMLLATVIMAVGVNQPKWFRTNIFLSFKLPKKRFDFLAKKNQKSNE